VRGESWLASERRLRRRHDGGASGRSSETPPSDLGLEATALLRELGAGRVPRLVLIHGAEPLLVDELAAQIAAAVLTDPAAAAWNREVLQADTVTGDALVTAGRALPLFGQRRLLLVRGLAEAPAKALDRLRDAIAGARAAPGGWPADGTVIVLLAPGADRKSPALRVLPPADQVEVKAPAPRALPGWLRGRAREAGLDLAPAAAEALVELVGDDLSRLAGELEKAAVFVGPDGRVGVEVVRALAGESRVRRYWELGQALEAADRARALAVLAELLDADEEPTVLLGQIVGHLRDVWRVKSALAEGEDPREVAPLRRGRPAFAVERVMAREEAVAGRELADGIRHGFDVELRLKTRGGEAAALLTLLVAELARG